MSIEQNLKNVSISNHTNEKHEEQEQKQKQEQEQEEENEELNDQLTLEVPKNYLQFPLGFVVDAGGSVTKIIYRSNEDYKDRKPLKDFKHGQLRLKYFPIGQSKEVIDFLKANCDICLDDTDRKIVWKMTGVSTQFFKNVLDKEFGIETNLYSEPSAISDFSRVYHSIPGVSYYHIEPSSVQQCQHSLHFFVGATQKWKKDGDKSMELLPELDENDENLKFLGKMMVNPAERLCKELNEVRPNLRPPFLIVLIGSACVMSLVTETYQMKPVDFLSFSGKTLWALGETLTGEKDFNKLMKLAENGDHRKVDLLTNDIRNIEHEEDDWYAPMPIDSVVFEMGKLNSSNYCGRGECKKEDVANGLVHMFGRMVAKIVLLNAKIHKASSVVFCGSLVKNRVARLAIEENFLFLSLMNTLEKNPLTNLYFLKKPGFINGLGVWIKNIEMYEERISSKGKEPEKNKKPG